MHRPTFIKQSALVSGAVTLNPMASLRSDRTYQADVIIIGAGLSGLYAAMELQKSNISYKIIEANNRVGGRLHTLPNGLEIGALEVGDGYNEILNVAN